MNGFSEIEYLKSKQAEFPEYTVYDWFNPSMNVELITKCRMCSEDFNEFKNESHYEGEIVTLSHPPSCLWYDFYVRKIKQINPDCKISRNRNRKK